MPFYFLVLSAKIKQRLSPDNLDPVIVQARQKRGAEEGTYLYPSKAEGMLRFKHKVFHRNTSNMKGLNMFTKC